MCRVVWPHECTTASMVMSWTFLISILTHLDVIIFNLVLIAKNVNEKATGVILQAGSVFAFLKLSFVFYQIIGLQDFWKSPHILEEKS